MATCGVSASGGRGLGFAAAPGAGLTSIGGGSGATCCGGGFYYTVGSYACSDGKWKGEMTSREHSPISGTYPWARKVLTIGFIGNYSDDGATFEATALAGKQSFRFKSDYRLLFAD